MAAPQLASLDTLYRSRISRQFETVEFLGLPHYKEEAPLRLDQIYVPLSFTRQPNGDERLFLPAVLEENRHVVILGDPGSGKSTLVKLLAYSFASLEQTPLAARFGALLPIPIILRDYQVREWQSPEDMLRAYIERLDHEKLREQLTPEWLMAALREQRAILLLDGLDEVGSVEDRRTLREKVIHPLLFHTADRSYIVITSRIIGYDEVPVEPQPLDLSGDNRTEGAVFFNEWLQASPPISRYYVARFDTNDIEKFVTRWYTARERDTRRRSEGIESLKRAITGNPRIGDLAGNPSLLTLMALIHRVNSDLPSGRVKLYDRIAEAYLETLQRQRKLEPYPASLDEMKRWLGEVAWRMQERREENPKEGLTAARQDMLGWLQEAMRQRLNAATEASQFLEYIERRSGLVVERGPQTFGFVHLTFQEYFAAWKLRGRVWAIEDLGKTCTKLARSSEWHETIILLFELLEEFEGAGDALALMLCNIEDDKTKHAAADLLSGLLSDEVNGLSAPTIHVIVEHCLHVAASRYKHSIVKNLSGVLDKQLIRKTVNDWIERQVQLRPSELPDDFLLLWQILLTPVEAQSGIETYLKRHQSESWSEANTTYALWATNAPSDLITWAVRELPLRYWFDPMPGLLCTPAALVYSAQLSMAASQSAYGVFIYSLGTLAKGMRILLAKSCCLKGGRVIVKNARLVDNYRWRPLNKELLHLSLDNRTTERLISRHVAADFSILAAVALPNIENVEAFRFQLIKTSLSAINESGFSGPNGTSITSAVTSQSNANSSQTDFEVLLEIVCDLLFSRASSTQVKKLNRLVLKGIKNPLEFSLPSWMDEFCDRFNLGKDLPYIFQRVFMIQSRPWLDPKWFLNENPDSEWMLSEPDKFSQLVERIVSKDPATHGIESSLVGLE